MKSLFNYIISTESRYNNKKSIDEKELILNTETTERDYMFVNRLGTVLSEPAYGVTSKTPKKGDAVIVHHNVFRRWIDIRGDEKNSSSFLKENEFFVASDQIFAYKRNGRWHCPNDYCFVKPIAESDEWSSDIEQKLKGELVYSNDELVALGLAKGDTVGFTPDSEYEFEIDGQKLYRILSNQVTINYGSEKKSSSSS
jgi:hypothetical protein